ncbi:MAG: hypothetical protein WBC04_18810 [Candidatus Acidiferrales bacterium]|jgi:hypothetical protein
MRICAGILVLLLASNATRAAGPPPSKAADAFQKLQSLAGEWEGKDERGRSARTTFQSMVSHTAVMETLAASDMDEMVTLYSVDGDGILLVHYCPTGNQPRMRAISPDGNVRTLIFSFVGAGNLPSPSTGHEQKLVIEFEDDNHITERWTWRENGHDMPMVFHFTRKTPH